MTDVIWVAAVVLAVNLLPVMGPPTWAVLVLLRLHTGLALPLLVAVGAASATGGRVLLALATRRVAHRLPAERVARLVAAGELLQRDRKRVLAGVAAFLLSPVPSAQLFEAAGLLRVRLLPLASAFLLGRAVSYTVYAGAATAAERSWGDLLERSLLSWPGLALQAGLLLGVWQLSSVDWVARLGRSRAEGPPRR